MEPVLWCITGSGHFLRESVDKLHSLIEQGLTIDIAMSRAGFEVASMYGFMDKIKGLSRYLFMEGLRGNSAPLVGRVAQGEYSSLIVSPASANTVAKIVTGVADTLITNLVAQAGKSRIQTYILPTDQEQVTTTRLPVNLDHSLCVFCDPCSAAERCPRSAIKRDPDYEGMRLNLLNCNACLMCIRACPYDALSFGKEVRIHMRKLDLDNTDKLKKIEGIRVLSSMDGLEFF